MSFKSPQYFACYEIKIHSLVLLSNISKEEGLVKLCLIQFPPEIDTFPMPDTTYIYTIMIEFFQ